jgi:hypothetical protein
MPVMSELLEKRWAVISERGVEATAMLYDEALKLLRRLQSEKVYGLCIVTTEAAERDALAPPARTKK